MTLEELIRLVESGQPLEGISDHLKALAFDWQGDWDRAHKSIQEYEDPLACWIHAYLHRKEGDLSKASYWYRRAGRDDPRRGTKLEEEWKLIAGAALHSGPD